MNISTPDIYNNLNAFNLSWQLSKGTNTWYATPSKEFWSYYRENKERIKEAGFWVSNATGKWKVYYKEGRHDLIGNRQSVGRSIRRRKDDPYWKKIF